MPLDLDQGGRTPQVHRVYLGPSLGWILADEPLDIELVISGGTNYISTGVKGTLVIPEWVTVRNWVMVAEAAGNITIDVWKIPLANYLAGTIPTQANSICGTDVPILFNQVARRSYALTGWTTFIEQNDVLIFNVPNFTSVRRVTISIQTIRNKGTGG